jgi:RNA polymerase sigma factor (sigma-70 family)
MDTNPKYSEDRQLVERIRAGDHAAVETLLLDLCSQSLLHLSRDFKIEYEDLLGDLYVHLSDDGWKRLGQWEGRCSLRRWVELIAIRLCLDNIKKKFPKSVLIDHNLVSLMEDPGSDGDATRLEARRAEVLRAVNELPSSKERLLILMHCIMGLEIAETAKALNVTTQNAYQIKSRALRRLRLTLEGRLANVDS